MVVLGHFWVPHDDLNYCQVLFSLNILLNVGSGGSAENQFLCMAQVPVLNSEISIIYYSLFLIFKEA